MDVNVKLDYVAEGQEEEEQEEEEQEEEREDNSWVCHPHRLTDVPGNRDSTRHRIGCEQACAVHAKPKADPLDRRQMSFLLPQVHTYAQTYLLR